MTKNQQLKVKDTKIILLQQNKQDFISLTDIAKYKNLDHPRYVVQNWMKTKFSIEFLGIWEKMHNSNFNRVEFGAFKNQAGANSFVMTPHKWITSTNAIGIISKAGRYGGTYAHKDIAFEFASWISPEFKLFLIKEFQRLKEEEIERLQLNWDLKRNLAAVNYRIHTDAIKDHLIPSQVTKKQASITYANEADVLNKALFGRTAKEWRTDNPEKKGNIRDYATVQQLVCLSNLESINAELIKQNIPQSKRLQQLNSTAITQMKSLLKTKSVKKLEQKND
jgi:hypothetical protein